MASFEATTYEQFMQDLSQHLDISKMNRRSSQLSTMSSSRRHSARVEKPRSHHPSPRTPDRRRVRHYSTLDDHYNRMMGVKDDEGDDDSTYDYKPTTRPVSWHPSSMSFMSNSSNLYQANASPYDQYMSYQNSPMNYGGRQLSQAETTWTQYLHGEVVTTGSSQPLYTTTRPSSRPNSSNNHFQADKTEPEEDTVYRTERESSVELVGLGLYDEPGFTIATTLKLEEECDVPEPLIANDPDEDSSEEEEEELPSPPEDIKPAQQVVDMSGRSFFFGEDEPAVTWWSENPKQPQSNVAAVNYGWS